MSKINKILILLITAALLLGCSDKTETGTETTETETVQITTEAEITPLDALTGLDFQGASFRVKYNELFEAEVYRESFLLNAEELNGEILNRRFRFFLFVSQHAGVVAGQKKIEKIDTNQRTKKKSNNKKKI